MQYVLYEQCKVLHLAESSVSSFIVLTEKDSEGGRHQGSKSVSLYVCVCVCAAGRMRGSRASEELTETEQVCMHMCERQTEKPGKGQKLSDREGH